MSDAREAGEVYPSGPKPRPEGLVREDGPRSTRRRCLLQSGPRRARAKARRARRGAIERGRRLACHGSVSVAEAEE